MNEVSIIIVFIVIVVFFTLLVLIIMESNELFLEYRQSKLNNKKYGIQEQYNESDEAVELLAKLHNYMTQLVSDLNNKIPNDERVQRLVKGFKKTKIEEAPDDDGSSFTINKGEMMGICLREKNESRPFHDYNTLLFVVIHEMAHVASVSEGHNSEFITNFRWLLREAKQFGYYDPVNYQNSPMTYCGVKVTNNPYF